MTFRDSKGLDYKDVLLVPQYSEIESRSKVDISSWLTPKIKIQVPVVSANMDTITSVKTAAAMSVLGGAGILHRYAKPENIVQWITFLKETNVYPIIPSIGVGEEQMDLAKAYIGAGAHAINIDIAHADSSLMVKTIRRLALINIDVIAGNIATPEAARRLISEGAVAVKAGVANGGVCLTKYNTGAGYPQFSCISEIAPIVHELGGCLIADGGVREIGDINKALGAGADTVMVGWLLRGSAESECEGEYRGMASAEAQNAFKGFAKNVEGRSVKTEYRGTIYEIMTPVIDGIRSGFSYAGAHNVKELQENAEFVIVKS